MQPLLDAPPPVHAYAPGTWGPEAADALVADVRRLARARGWSHERPRAGSRGAPRRPRRSRRSPTTRSSPTATRARSSRRTGRSTGCAFPASTRRASSPACSTARRASSASRRSASTTRPRALYEPGTNVLVTTWKTPSGWVVVRDALTMGPREQRGRRSRRTRGRRRTTMPTTCWCGRSSASRARSRSTSSASRSFDYGRTAAEWTLVDGDRHAADASGAGQTIRLAVGPRARHRGRPRAGPARARPGRARVLRALVGRGARRPAGRRRRRGEDRRHHALLARLAGAGAHARPPLPRTRSSARRSRSRA